MSVPAPSFGHVLLRFNSSQRLLKHSLTVLRSVLEVAKMGNSLTRRELFKAGLGTVIASRVASGEDKAQEKLKDLAADFTDDFSVDGPMDANKWVAQRNS